MGGLVGVGDPAPDFELPDQHETAVRLSRRSARGPGGLELRDQVTKVTALCGAASTHRQRDEVRDER